MAAVAAVPVATTRSKVRKRVYIAPQRNVVLAKVYEMGEATAADCGVEAPYMILLAGPRHGLLRVSGTRPSGKPGRPPVTYKLTDKGRKRIKRALGL
jgi:hypothetical protein